MSATRWRIKMRDADTGRPITRRDLVAQLHVLFDEMLLSLHQRNQDSLLASDDLDVDEALDHLARMDAANDALRPEWLQRALALVDLGVEH